MVFIRIDQYLTDKRPQVDGVPQSFRFALLLFTVFNAELDFFSGKAGVSVLVYANDLALGHTDLSKLDQAKLISDKNCVNDDLEFKTGRTNVMKIRRTARLCHNDQLTNINTPLDFMNSLNYLGVILQTNTNPNKHLKHLSRKALVGTLTLSMKKDLAKVQLTTAKTPFETITLPPANFFWRFLEKNS